MKLLLILCFLTLWNSGFCEEASTPPPPPTSSKNSSDGFHGKLIGGIKSAITGGLGIIAGGVPTGRKLLHSSSCPEIVYECPNEHVTFWHYTRASPKAPIQLSLSNFSSIQNLLEDGKPWKFIIHGFTKSKDHFPNPLIRSAYLEKGEYHLVSVDYAPLAKKHCIPQATRSINLVANCTAQLIDILVDKELFQTEHLHIIGFSMGAQIAGSIHEFLRHKKPFRITALDPFAPLFDAVVHENLRLTSAEFVDVIHTNALFKGQLNRGGHVDFFVNGGLHQPGCGIQINQTYSECSHDRSAIYFAESINSRDGFYGIPCDSYIKFYSGLCDTTEAKLVPIGENTHRETRGSFFLETANKPPYALGKRSNVITVLKRNLGIPF